MAGNEYVFITEWQIPGQIERISSVLEDIESFPRWCPSVYLDVTQETPGNAEGVGKRVKILSKGKLPYKLRWAFTVVESTKPHGFRIQANGDFEGAGIWSLKQNGDVVDVVYDWRIRAQKPLIKAFSGILKPVFRKNHIWAMAETHRGLVAELARRYP